MRKFLFFLFLILSANVSAQLGFCEGSKGDPIFHEDFNSGEELPPGTTSYTYVSTRDPGDGEYNITDDIGNEITGWHNFLPQTTISNGNAMIVNADYTAGQFFEIEIPGLCESTTYEFSAFLINILDGSQYNGGGIPINVRFQILDQTGEELAEGSTGDINELSSPVWEQYALTFRTEIGQNSVILKMFNNSDGGNGNDLAIDDIIFRSCGDLTTVTSEKNEENEFVVCEPDAPVSLKLIATPDESVYEEHAFQWQESDDNQDWEDITGETGENYTTPDLNSSKYYRVKVAEDPANLHSNECSSASDAYYIKIVEKPEAPIGQDEIICSLDEIPVLRVEVEGDETVNWYDSETEGNLIAAQTSSFKPNEEGTFYAEAIKTGYECEGSSRTAIKLTINQSPQVEDEELELCKDEELQLNAGLENMTYQWSTGETTQEITVSQYGNLSVIITSDEGCKAEKNFKISTVDVAGIQAINLDGNTVTIVPENQGEFEFSLNGQDFQESNVFPSVKGGVYTAYVRDLQNCNTVSEEFPHIVVPKFITPNDDGYNDNFEINGLDYFAASEIRIFDRYGKLIKTGPGENFRWGGTYNGKNIPATDYWYEIKIEDYKVIKGHFSLVR